MKNIYYMYNFFLSLIPVGIFLFLTVVGRKDHQILFAFGWGLLISNILHMAAYSLSKGKS